MQRKLYICLTYTITAILLFLAILQWFLFKYLLAINLFFVLYYWIGIVFFILSLILMLLFVFIEKIRFYTPINWIFAFLAFECAVLGVTTLIVRHYKYHFLIEFGVWTLVLIIFLLIGSFVPHDLTMDVVVIVIIGIFATIGSMYFLMLYMVLNVPFSFFVYRALFVIGIASFIMYHAQIINGGRFAEMRDADYLLGALILFFDFLLMFLFTFHLAPKWSDLCDVQRNKTDIFVLDLHIKSTTSSDNNSQIFNTDG